MTMSTSLKKIDVLPRNLLNYIRTGKSQEVKIIIEKYGMNYEKSWQGGYTLLLHALKHKQKAVAEYFLTQNPQLCDDKNQSLLLHQAVRIGSKKLVQNLLKCGADYQVEDSTFRTPLQIALDNNFFKIAELIIKKCGIGKLPISICANSLLYRVLFQNMFILKMLLKEKNKNLNINLVKNGHTLLQKAILEGNVSVVKCLLENNADIHLKSSNYKHLQYTALHLAVSEHNSEIVSLLLQYGARLDAKNKDKETPFFMALKLSHYYYDVIEAFINHGVDLDSPVDDNQPPLYWALTWNLESLVKLLISNGANVDIHDNQGKSYLYNFFKSANINAVKHLLIYGAEINLKEIEQIANLVEEKKKNYLSSIENLKEYTILYLMYEIILKQGSYIFFAKNYALTKSRFVKKSKKFKKFKDMRRSLDQLVKRKVCGNLTFYSLFQRAPQYIAPYLKNPKFIAATEDVDWIEDIPYYGGFIFKKLGSAVKRRKLLENGGERGLYTVFPIPYDASEKIILYLNNLELKNLINAILPEKKI